MFLLLGYGFLAEPPSSGTGSWTETVLYAFKGGSDGADPLAGLILDSKRNLYGTTSEGGSVYGVVFELSPPISGTGSWTETLLDTFNGGNGAAPQAGLIFDSEGNLYGTTTNGNGNQSGAGVVFELSTLPPATPTFSPSSGTYTPGQTVTISDATAGATIYYTTNGTTPTTVPTNIYTGAITVNSTETIKAIALVTGNYNAFSISAVATATYTIIAAPPQAATPSFSLASGSYAPAQSVTISDATAEATIYYTTNGTTPTTASTMYTGAITVNSTETIEAIAVASGYSTSPAATATYTISAVPAYLFVPVTPCRIADTRNANGTFGGPSLSSGSSRSFPIPSSSCSTPSTAAAYALNVTVVPNGSLGYITMWPTGQAQPLVSTLNSLDGRVKANAAIVPAGTSGAISVFASNATNVILDIDGYFVPTTVSSALAFYPSTPCRVADTRNATGALGGPSLVGSEVRSFPVLSSSCGIPSSAQAYSLNFTAIPQGTLGYLSVWPAGQSQPVVSTLNAPTGTVTANAAIVPAGAGGAIDLYTTNNADMVIDVNGYFAPPGSGGLSLYTLTPCRVLDTRQGGVQPFSGTLNVNVTGASTCGVPLTAHAYVFNATVVPPNALGYLTLWPEGTAQPLVSTLNALDGSITSNMAIVPAASGSVSAFASNPTQLILDISGYFGP